MNHCLIKIGRPPVIIESHDVLCEGRRILASSVATTPSAREIGGNALLVDRDRMAGMDDTEVERILEDVEVVACLQAPLLEAKELRDACLAAEIPALLARGECCGSGGCGCAPKLALYARPEDVPRVARLVEDRWRALAQREGTVRPDRAPPVASPVATDTPCPACGTAAPLANGACTDCGLQLE